MNKRITIAGLWLAILGAGFVGCQSSDEIDAVPEVVEATPAVTPATKPSESTSDNTSVENNPDAAKLTVAQFVPPFPERLELFEPPKRAQGTVRRDEQGGETVELKGFVNVDKPRVVLLIDGVIAPIPEGGEKYGVQVISIQPPNAVLQRGRSRWTATLE
jgi:hypothetical protein